MENKVKWVISKMPKRFSWTIHNLIAHPLCEILHQLGFDHSSEKAHDWTVPDEESENQ